MIKRILALGGISIAITLAQSSSPAPAKPKPAAAQPKPAATKAPLWRQRFALEVPDN